MSNYAFTVNIDPTAQLGGSTTGHAWITMYSPAGQVVGSWGYGPAPGGFGGYTTGLVQNESARSSQWTSSAVSITQTQFHSMNMVIVGRQQNPGTYSAATENCVHFVRQVMAAGGQNISLNGFTPEGLRTAVQNFAGHLGYGVGGVAGGGSNDGGGGSGGGSPDPDPGETPPDQGDFDPWESDFDTYTSIDNGDGTMKEIWSRGDEIIYERTSPSTFPKEKTPENQTPNSKIVSDSELGIGGDVSTIDGFGFDMLDRNSIGAHNSHYLNAGSTESGGGRLKTVAIANSLIEAMATGGFSAQVMAVNDSDFYSPPKFGAGIY